MESEAALAKIDAYLGGHGFRSQPVERKTPSGFVAARRWTKPGNVQFPLLERAAATDSPDARLAGEGVHRAGARGPGGAAAITARLRASR